MKGVQSGNGKGWHPFESGIDSILTGWAGPIPKSAYVAWYKMNEGTGTTFFDSIAANNATVTGSGSWVSDVYNFNQTGYATAGDAALTAFTSNTPFSVSLWFNTAYPGSQQGIVGNLSSGLVGWVIQVQSSAINLYLGTYPGTYMSVSSAAIGTSVTQNVVMTFDGSAYPTGVTFYLNGVAGTSIIQYGTGANSATLPLSIGGTQYDANNISLYGSVQDIRIFNTVLNQTQINYLYNGGPQ